MDRRTFLSIAASLAALDASAQSGAIPIIDTHIHLFDPTRPQGVPWPFKDDKIMYRPALPDRYRQVTKGLGIVGAIEIECSSWLEDNQWVLDIAAKDTIIVGTVGDLEPGKPDFRKNLERFHRNPLFRGIRWGNLWGRNLAEDVSRGEFISDLKALAEADLALDTANQDPALISAAVRLTDKVPNLRVVIDHLPHLEPPVNRWRAGSFRPICGSWRRARKYMSSSRKCSAVLTVRSTMTWVSTGRGWMSSGEFSERTKSCMAVTGRIAIPGVPTCRC